MPALYIVKVTELETGESRIRRQNAPERTKSHIKFHEFSGVIYSERERVGRVMGRNEGWGENGGEVTQARP